MKRLVIGLVVWLAFAGNANAVTLAPTLTRITGATTGCYEAAEWFPAEKGLMGFHFLGSIGLRQEVCDLLERSLAGERGERVVFAWVVLGHEYGHHIGFDHDACPTATRAGIARIPLLAKRAGLPLDYRHWLRTEARGWWDVRALGEIRCDQAH